MKKSLVVVLLLVFGSVVADQIVKTDSAKKASSEPKAAFVAADKKSTPQQNTKSTSVKNKFINAQEVFEGSYQGQQFKQEVTAEARERQEAFQKEGQELVKAENDFVKKSQTINEETRRKEEKRLAQLKRDLDTRAKESQEEFDLLLRKKNEKLMQEFHAVVKEYGQEKDLDSITDVLTGQTIYVADRVKCTEDVVVAMNRNYSGPLKKDGVKEADLKTSKSVTT
jgi:Skp family chaperone for outer membrane proteins